MELQLIILLFTFLSLLLSKIFEQKDGTYVIRKLGVVGKLIIVFSTLGFLSTLIKTCIDEKNEEIEEIRKEKQLEIDSIRHVEQVIVDSITIASLNKEYEASQEIISLSKRLNSEFQYKVRQQNELIKNQERIIYENRYSIPNIFLCNFDIWIKDDSLVNLATSSNAAVISKEFSLYIPSNYSINEGKLNINNPLVSYIRQIFGNCRIGFEFTTQETKQKLEIEHRFSIEKTYVEGSNPDNEVYHNFWTLLYYYPEKELFRLQIANVPLRIRRRDPVFSSLYNIKRSYSDFFFYSDNFIQRYTLNKISDNASISSIGKLKDREYYIPFVRLSDITSKGIANFINFQKPLPVSSVNGHYYFDQSKGNE